MGSVEETRPPVGSLKGTSPAAPGKKVNHMVQPQHYDHTGCHGYMSVGGAYRVNFHFFKR